MFGICAINHSIQMTRTADAITGSPKLYIYSHDSIIYYNKTLTLLRIVYTSI